VVTEYQHFLSESIIEVRPQKFNGVGPGLYFLQRSVRRLFKGISDGPSEVRRSLKILEKSKLIQSRSSNKLPLHNLLWVGYGKVTKNMLENISKSSPNKLVLGPNLDIHDLGVRKLFDETPQSMFIVPSAWVQSFFVEELGMSFNRVKVWVAGVDSKKWSPTKSKKNVVLIYIKGDYSNYASQIEAQAIERGYESVILEYGSYSQSEYFKTLNVAKFAVFLIGTESQGIAQFQAWSMDVPTLVLSQPRYRIEEGVTRDIDASSSPYLSPQTGRFFDGPHDKAAVQEFIESLDSFSPRIWIQNNYTFEKSAEKFLDLFREY
jgi:glycosyltransferase involved in cell wall biosynthesis